MDSELKAEIIQARRDLALLLAALVTAEDGGVDALSMLYHAACGLSKDKPFLAVDIGNRLALEIARQSRACPSAPGSY